MAVEGEPEQFQMQGACAHQARRSRGGERGAAGGSGGGVGTGVSIDRRAGRSNVSTRRISAMTEARISCFSSCANNNVILLPPEHLLNHRLTAVTSRPHGRFHHNIFTTPQRCFLCKRLQGLLTRIGKAPVANACKKRPRDALAPAENC